MNYKDVIYGNYIKHHTQNMYGFQSLETIKAQFPVWRKYFQRVLPSSKEATILDIGCGSGGFVYFLQSLDYIFVEGVDISNQQIMEGEKLGISNLYCDDINNFLQTRELKYDCIIARDVMEHFTKEEIFAVLKLVKLALRKGGSFIMQSPNGEGLNFSALYYSDFTHEIAFTRNSLNQIFLNIGFTEVTFYPTGPVPYNLISTIRFILWYFLVAKIRFYRAIETGSFKGIFTQNIIAKAILK